MPKTKNADENEKSHSFLILVLSYWLISLVSLALVLIAITFVAMPKLLYRDFILSFAPTLLITSLVCPFVVLLHGIKKIGRTTGRHRH